MKTGGRFPAISSPKHPCVIGVSSVAESLPRWPLHLALLLWILFASALSIKDVFWAKAHSVYYPHYETGARLWWAGQDVYKVSPTYKGCPFEFRYGPACAEALVPLALLPTPLGGLLWSWLNLGLFFGALRTFMRRILPGCWTPGREGIFLCLVLVGVARSIWSGQSNLLIFALVALGMAAIADRRWWLAALMLAIPVHIKVWPLAVALLLIACRPRPLALRFGVCLLAVGALPLLTHPFAWVCRQYGGWYEVLMGSAQIRHSYRDMWTIWETIRPPVNAHIYMALQLATAAGVLGLCLWQARRRQSLARLLLFILVMWTSWQMEFGPATERNTFGLIAPLTCWGLMTAFAERRGRIVMTLAVLLTVMASYGIFERALRDGYPLMKDAHPLGVLLFTGWFLRWNWLSEEKTESRLMPACPAAEF